MRQKLSPEHGISPKKCTRTTAHDRSVHHAATRVTCGTIRASCVGAVSRRYYARKGKFHPARTHAIEQSCMCEAHGGADRNHDVIFRANAKKCMPGHVLELFVPALMLPRACAVHARNAHSRREHKMGDKCIPAAPIWLLMPILASIMTHYIYIHTYIYVYIYIYIHRYI